MSSFLTTSLFIKTEEVFFVLGKFLSFEMPLENRFYIYVTVFRPLKIKIIIHLNEKRSHFKSKLSFYHIVHFDIWAEIF